ncbi:hypothetical protein CEXT_320751 [Caerostris extrusa]|uniref:Uncharacterized protein n=1 Tax=Caerostris extrusa TaxID=172846 RepID=A0AAV4NAQ8_CAEEX|nr:hypothetical protein CEXT_320751 [Caerostris extrusa]
MLKFIITVAPKQLAIQAAPLRAHAPFENHCRMLMFCRALKASDGTGQAIGPLHHIHQGPIMALPVLMCVIAEMGWDPVVLKLPDISNSNWNVIK